MMSLKFIFKNIYLDSCLHKNMRILNRANDHYIRILCHNVMFFRGTFLNIYNTFKRVISPCWICMFVCKFVVLEVIVRKGLTGNMAIGPVGRNLCHATLLSDV